MENQEIFNIENERLLKVIDVIKDQIASTQEKFDKQKNTVISIGEGMKGAHFTREALMSMYAVELYRLKKIVDNPYFGKMDFKIDNKIDELYIGKKTIMLGNEILTYDWRSPIASMYYDYSIGKAQYEAPNGTVKGDILKKTQIIIENGKLIDVEEQDTLTDDKILLKYLRGNADNRLKSIVATIQKEQNQIIRNPNKKNSIVQGVAGSGKTTVALHRIAYLLYDNSRNINEANFMILGPNKYFLNYISELLPDLDIKNVSQSTFDDIALKNLDVKVKLENNNVTLQKILSNKINSDVIKYKSSIEYMNLIKEFILEYITNNMNNSIEFAGVELCNKKKIEGLLLSLQTSKTGYGKSINEFIKSLIKETKSSKSDLSHEVWLLYRDEFLSLEKSSPRRKEILDVTNNIQKEIELGCPKQIKNYFSFMKINSLDLYKNFIESLNSEKLGKSAIDIDELKEITLKNLKTKNIGIEDLVPLLYINYLFKDIKPFNEISRLVIDEGQDLSMAQYFVLKQLFPNSNFEIFGDLNQSIYDYQGIQSWDELGQKIFNNGVQRMEMNKGYRTTEQICDSANYVLSSIGAVKSDNVAREGEDILINKIDSSHIDVQLLTQIESLLHKKYKTIAIICKDSEETDRVHKKLVKMGLNINKISEKDLTYKGGICIMPSYLSKGLEFDSVIIYDANCNNYAETSKIDMKLLYVSITRALHELYINYSDELTKPLQKYLKRDVKIKVLKKSE